MAIARRAQFKNIGPAPVPRMTNGKRVLILSLALLFDAIKFMCTQLWFFGPALIGLAGSAAVGGGWVGAAVGTVVGAGSLATLGAGIEALGVILAMAVGLIGWMTMIVIMMGIRMQPFHSRNFISVFFGFLVSEIPFVDAVPSITIAMWRIVQGERRADKEARQKWEAENAEALRQQRRQALLEEQQFRDLNAAEEAQAAQDEQDAIDAQAAADAAAAQEAEDDIPLPVAQPARQPLVGTPSL